MSETDLPPTQPPAWRTAIRRILITLIVVGLCTGAWYGVKYANGHFALERSRRALDGKEYSLAEFWAKRALESNNKNVDATRMMAEIADAENNRTALLWRARVLELAPGQNADVLASAKSAMQFGDAEMAMKTLKSLPQEFADQSAEYNDLMANGSLAINDLPNAEKYFVKAADLDSQNPVHRVNLAALRLSSTNPELRAEALKQLEAASEEPQVSLFATRALFREAIHSGDKARARRFAEKLQTLPGHGFGDELDQLDAEISEPSFREMLKALEHRAESDVKMTAALGAWLNVRWMSGEMLSWYGRLPKDVAADPGVQVAAADAYMRLYDWGGLQKFLKSCVWTGNGNFLKTALEVRCKRELSEPWEDGWKELAQETKKNQQQSLLLANLVLGWGWRPEAKALFWFASTPAWRLRSDSQQSAEAELPVPDPAASLKIQKQALLELWKISAPASESLEMLEVAKAQLELEPDNAMFKNNYAFLSLLLNGASKNAEQLASEATTANPAAPEWAATYAYALHLAGKDDDAEKALSRLTPADLNKPGVALYYAIVLAAKGDDTHAKEALMKINGNGMLPEEARLATTLMRRIEADGH